MKSAKTGLRIAAVIFAIVSLAHLYRLLEHVPVRIGSYDVPEWPSYIAIVGPALLCIWLLRLSSAVR
jgi:hypothetical protein